MTATQASLYPRVRRGNSFPHKPIGAARATDWEGGGSLPAAATCPSLVTTPAGFGVSQIPCGIFGISEIEVRKGLAGLLPALGLLTSSTPVFSCGTPPAHVYAAKGGPKQLGRLWRGIPVDRVDIGGGGYLLLPKPGLPKDELERQLRVHPNDTKDQVLRALFNYDRNTGEHVWLGWDNKPRNDQEKEYAERGEGWILRLETLDPTDGSDAAKLNRASLVAGEVYDLRQKYPERPEAWLQEQIQERASAVVSRELNRQMFPSSSWKPRRVAPSRESLLENVIAFYRKEDVQAGGLRKQLLLLAQLRSAWSEVDREYGNVSLAEKIRTDAEAATYIFWNGKLRKRSEVAAELERAEQQSLAMQRGLSLGGRPWNTDPLDMGQLFGKMALPGQEEQPPPETGLSVLLREGPADLGIYYAGANGQLVDVLTDSYRLILSTLRREEDARTLADFLIRAGGVLKVAAGFGEGFVAKQVQQRTLGLAAPLTAGMVLHGASTVKAGVEEAVTGSPVRSVFEQTLEFGLRDLGWSKENAGRVAMAGDIVGPGGVALAGAVSLRLGSLAARGTVRAAGAAGRLLARCGVAGAELIAGAGGVVRRSAASAIERLSAAAQAARWGPAVVRRELADIGKAALPRINRALPGTVIDEAGDVLLYTGVQQARARQLLENVARAANVNLSHYVDDVVFVSRNIDGDDVTPFFQVIDGRRTIGLPPQTLARSRAGQMIDAYHELNHARHSHAFGHEAYALMQNDPLLQARIEVLVQHRAIRQAQRVLGNHINQRVLNRELNYITQWDLNHWASLVEQFNAGQ
jgi:hypothetical protein